MLSARLSSRESFCLQLHRNPSLVVAPDPSRLSRVLGTLFEESWLPALLLHALIFSRQGQTP